MNLESSYAIKNDIVNNMHYGPMYAIHARGGGESCRVLVFLFGNTYSLKIKTSELVGFLLLQGGKS